MKNKKIQINSNLSFKHQKHHLEHNSGEIIVEPGHAYTIKELFERAKRGQMPNIKMYEQDYVDESHHNLDFPDPTRDPEFGLSDADTIIKQTEEENNLKKVETEAENTQNEPNEKVTEAPENDEKNKTTDSEPDLPTGQ